MLVVVVTPQASTTVRSFEASVPLLTWTVTGSLSVLFISSKETDSTDFKEQIAQILLALRGSSH